MKELYFYIAGGLCLIGGLWAFDWRYAAIVGGVMLFVFGLFVDFSGGKIPDKD